MKITRIDKDRDIEQNVDRIQLDICGKRFTLSEEFGELTINCHSDSIAVKPCYGNEIKLIVLDS